MPPTTGLNVTCDVEGGVSAALVGALFLPRVACAPRNPTAPALWDCLLICVMKGVGDFSVSKRPFHNAS